MNINWQSMKSTLTKAPAMIAGIFKGFAHGCYNTLAVYTVAKWFGVMPATIGGWLLLAIWPIIVWCAITYVSMGMEGAALTKYIRGEAGQETKKRTQPRKPNHWAALLALLAGLGKGATFAYGSSLTLTYLGITGPGLMLVCGVAFVIDASVSLAKEGKVVSGWRYPRYRADSMFYAVFSWQSLGYIYAGMAANCKALALCSGALGLYAMLANVNKAALIGSPAVIFIVMMIFPMLMAVSLNMEGKGLVKLIGGKPVKDNNWQLNDIAEIRNRRSWIRKATILIVLALVAVSVYATLNLGLLVAGMVLSGMIWWPILSQNSRLYGRIIPAVVAVCKGLMMVRGPCLLVSALGLLSASHSGLIIAGLALALIPAVCVAGVSAAKEGVSFVKWSSKALSSLQLVSNTAKQGFPGRTPVPAGEILDFSAKN